MILVAVHQQCPKSHYQAEGDSFVGGYARKGLKRLHDTALQKDIHEPGFHTRPSPTCAVSRSLAAQSR